MYKFTGLQLCKLTGLTYNQFQSFKLAGLIENKPRYTLNDVVYVAISNVFRNYKMSWSSIHKLYTEVFGSPEKLLTIVDESLSHKYLLISINFKKYLLVEDIDFIFRDDDPTLTDIVESGLFKQSSINIDGSCSENYIFSIEKIINEIINNSKNLKLKVNVEDYFQRFSQSR